MKKILALIAVAATLFSLSACKINGKMTAEERESSRVEQSLKVEREYIEGVNETVEDEIGKTVKGKRLVVRADVPTGYKYTVYEFDRKQMIKTQYMYEFFDLDINYYATLEIEEKSKYKQIDHDKKSRMVAYKRTEDLGEFDFDYFYDSFSQQFNIDRGYTIIE